MDYQILVIEDDKATSGFITSVLNRGKYSTYIASTGVKALKLIETFHFNLVLLDLMLADTPGSEILVQIRQKYTQAELPVVIISSKNDEQRIFDTFELGASDFITKPINEVALRIIVKNLLQLQKTSAELKETTSDLESANKELAENRQSLLFSQFVIENMQDLVLWIKPDGKFKYVNKAACEKLDYAKEELLSADITLIDPGFQYDVWKVYFGELKEKHTLAFESYFRKKSGELIPVEIHTNFFNYEGEDIACGIAHDISIRQAAFKKLSESEEKYREMFEFLPIAISISDLSGKVKQINKAAEHILGMPPEEHSGRNFDGEEWVIYRPDGTLMPTEEFASVKALHENKLIEDVEMIFSKPSGEKIWLNVTALPLPKFDQIIIAYSDITKKKQQETLIKIHNEQLKELNATKDKFFSLIAHDLKSPFNSIIGFSELLTNHINDYTPDKIIEFANLIRLSSRHAYELLKNLLEWARTQTGRIAYRPGKLYLKPLIEEVIESLQSNAFEKNIKVLPVITTNPIAEGDRYMVGSVLRNLISNAIKFTHKNGIIRIKTMTLNDEIQVSVIDPGVGIKPEIIQKLFKISEQTSTSGTNNEKGTGLGLIICKDFIDKHGGRIWVESQPGKGSVFHFTLPKI